MCLDKLFETFKNVEEGSVFGLPDKIEFTDQGTRNYIYITEKLKIKCERKFEINFT